MRAPVEERKSSCIEHTGEMNDLAELTIETLKMRENFYLLGRLNQ